MSRVADLLAGWSKDPAYTHDFAALARELQTRCSTEMAVTSPRVTFDVVRDAPPEPKPQTARKRAKSA